MIFKFFEIKKVNLKDKKYFLLYGKNEGLIEETIKETLKPKLPKNCSGEGSEVLSPNLHTKNSLATG